MCDYLVGFEIFNFELAPVFSKPFGFEKQWFFQIFQNHFSRTNAIYDYVSLPAQTNDFISETVTPEYLTKSKQLKLSAFLVQMRMGTK